MCHKMNYTNSKSEFRVKKLNAEAKIPQRATTGSAGYDLCACITEPVTIEAGERYVFPTGIALALPENTAGMIYTRSGLGIKHGIHVTNGVGVIDWDYRGEVKVGLHNLSHEPYTVNPGDRIAQLILTPVLTPEVTEAQELDDTDRGTGGFGSTGKN